MGSVLGIILLGNYSRRSGVPLSFDKRNPLKINSNNLLAEESTVLDLISNMKNIENMNIKIYRYG